MIVGIYSDAVTVALMNQEEFIKKKLQSLVNSPSSSTSKDCNDFPILSQQERALSVLSCKFSDDVLLDAPYVISGDMLDALKISIVVSEYHIIFNLRNIENNLSV